MNQISICVTGAGGPAGFNCIRSLRLSDLNVRIIALDMNKYASGLYHEADASYVVPPASSEEFLLALFRILDKEKVNVLLPTVDEEIRALCREHVLAELSELTDFLLPGEEAAARALNKFSTVDEARRAGLPVPKTLRVPQASDAESVSREFDLPFVVKPSCSRGARGISFVDARRDAEAAWKRASLQSGEVLFQEYVPGPVFTVGTVADPQGTVTASIVLRKMKEIPPTGGVAVAATTVADPELQELGESYVKSLGWRGPASPEIKVDERDGSYKLMEVNPRLFGYNYLAAVAGVNLPEMTVRLALGEKVEAVRSYREGLSFVRAPYDLIVEENIG